MHTPNRNRSIGPRHRHPILAPHAIAFDRSLFVWLKLLNYLNTGDQAKSLFLFEILLSFLVLFIFIVSPFHHFIKQPSE
jgi:hypothetical protein